jgi:hypothetical protein
MASSLLRRLRCLIAASLAIGGLIVAEEKQPSPGFTEDDLPLPMWNQEEWQKIAREAAPAPLGGLLPSLGEDPNLTASSLGPARNDL